MRSFMFIVLSVAMLELCVPILTEPCSEVTFVNNLVLIVQGEINYKQYITGCISSQKLYYNKFDQIIVSNQNIPVLHRAAVSHIANVFGLKILKNNIKKIKKHAFLNLNVNFINLNGNNLKWLESYSFENLPSLDLIELDENNIETLSRNTFVNLQNLSTISFSANELREFDQDWFSGTPKLEYLFLDKNKLRNIHKEAFSNFKNLKGITLEKNLIEYIDEYAFNDLNKLTELNLNHNKLKYFNINFSNTKSLRFLSIDSNRITYLPLEKFEAINKSLKTLWIHANPWQCTCFEQIGRWAEKSNVELWWKCRNVDLFCYTPTQNSELCRNRTDSELDENYLEFPTYDCSRIVVNEYQ